MEKTIDIAKWNNITNYKAILADGVSKSIIKAINCNDVPDSKFEAHYKGCVDAGIDVVGTYHYSYAQTTQRAKNSAQAWIKAVNGRCNMFWLDWEDSCLPKDGRAIDIILTYADIITKAGYKFGIYCGLSWYNSYLKKYADKLPYPFWIARYPSNSIMDDEKNPNDKYKPAINNTLAGWQYTSKGRVDGISGNVDLSVFYDVETASQPIVVPVDVNPYKEPYGTIRYGMRGDAVKWLQWCLYRCGLLLGADDKPDASKIDGIFGNQTLEALEKAQRILGLVEDGVAGKITKATFRKIC